jgi:hypothetical protein
MSVADVKESGTKVFDYTVENDLKLESDILHVILSDKKGPKLLPGPNPPLDVKDEDMSHEHENMFDILDQVYKLMPSPEADKLVQHVLNHPSINQKKLMMMTLVLSNTWH